MPRSDEQNTAIKDERRRQIMRAAVRVFARRGLAATRMAELASAAGISQGLAYHYFPSKEELFHQVACQAIAASQAAYDRALSLDGTGFERLACLVRGIVPKAYQDGGSDWFLISIQAICSAEVPQATRDLFGSGMPAFFERLLPIFQQGHNDGSIRPGSARAQIGILTGLFQGLTVLACLPDEGRPWMPDADSILNLFQAGGEHV